MPTESDANQHGVTAEAVRKAESRSAAITQEPLIRALRKSRPGQDINFAEHVCHIQHANRRQVLLAPAEGPAVGSLDWNPDINCHYTMYI
ncbi:hypothetical protein C0995_007595 [Termitomyces sp. Mi166|nr:hypothetical protein C0995_007595 [Termitomyces sp. Mi166\